MTVKGTYLQNNPVRSLCYGDIEIKNFKRKKLRGLPEKEGILAETVIAGFCGTDFELMKMGLENKLGEKFPKGLDRLVNGHEGLVYVPSQNRFAVVLIRGGDSYDPTRFTEDENYFEYGCDGADGLFSDADYYHPDMLLDIPGGFVRDGKVPLSFAKKMVFPDPYACMLFQMERMEDIGVAHNFRIETAKGISDETSARKKASENLFDKTVIFGTGATGMFIGDIIRQKHPNANIVYVGRSDEKTFKIEFALKQTKAGYVQNNFSTNKELANAIVKKLGGAASVFIGASGAQTEHEIAFEYGVLGNNGIFNSFSLGPKISFDTMPFGFKNQIILGSINFREDHMKKAIELLAESDYDKVVRLIDKNEFINDPTDAYVNKIYCGNAPLKTAVVWNEKYINMNI